MAEQVNESILLSPGLQLRAAREKAGLSVSDVADQLRQLPRQVEALENDDYQQFNAEFFCRSYLKTYGTLLGLDINDLLEAYSELRPRLTNETVTVTKRPHHIQRPTKGHSIHYWGAAATALIMVVLWWFSGAEVPEPSLIVPSTTAFGVDEQTVAVPEVLALPVAAESSDFERLIDPLTDNSVSSRLSETRIDEVVIVQPSDIEDADDAVVNSLLRLQFSSDCWVQVKDSNEVLLVADLKRAADTLELAGQPPFYVVLGYAPAVTVIFNGKPVQVPINSENNSARFVVGRS